MNHIHDNEVINTTELNLLHVIINPPKCTKFLKTIILLFFMDLSVIER